MSKDHDTTSSGMLPHQVADAMQAIAYAALSKCRRRDWKRDWVSGGVYLHLEVSELPEGATVIPAGRTKAEFGSMPIVLVVRGDEMRCAFVDEHSRCSIYEVRPKPCREYGKHKQLPCQELEPDKASRIGSSDAARQLDILRNGS